MFDGEKIDGDLDSWIVESPVVKVAAICGVSEERILRGMTRDPVLVQTERGSQIVKGISNVSAVLDTNRSRKQDTQFLR